MHISASAPSQGRCLFCAGRDLLRSFEEYDLGESGTRGCEGEQQYRTLISLLGLLATMRRVVNYHSSWARQRASERWLVGSISVGGILNQISRVSIRSMAWVALYSSWKALSSLTHFGGYRWPEQKLEATVFRPSVVYPLLCIPLYCCCFLPGCEGERQYRILISLLGLLATMRRVVNYHSSWARQRQVELFDASAMFEFLGSLVGCSLQLLSGVSCIASAFYLMHSFSYFCCSPYWGLTPCPSGAWLFSLLVLFSGNPGFEAGRGFNPAGGALGGG
ncbi:hypothetical protein F511_02025 [Dorcoceras hygrometricum]|uniref:Uncharacterized protein n=1 Tax=Dorcoceras hygrometricum TaxID=472368 RepID=A0A2Z7AVR7_9LAMI|nr:hypothetical protein F511_02025 [Dorcoceras hygrometricum]